MATLRPADLAREHGLSTQAVRNYERDGFLPPAERTRSGYRIYTPLHAAALRAFLALVPAYGHTAAGQIMAAFHAEESREASGAPRHGSERDAGRDLEHDPALDTALAVIDQGHGQLLRDRATLDAVREAITRLTEGAGSEADADDGPRTIGDLAHRLQVTPATLRAWEDAGILVPERDPATGYRVFGAADVRDAELAHLLRRGGYLLDHIAVVVRQIRTAGGADAVAESLDDWQRKLTARGLAMLDASARLSDYLALRAGQRRESGPSTP